MVERPEVVARASEMAKVVQYQTRLQQAVGNTQNKDLKTQLHIWEEEIITRRLAWAGQNASRISIEMPKASLVRQGFIWLMNWYMGVPLTELKIVKEDDRSIIWDSYDFCPYLQAILALGLDTKQVCKHATEKPCQVLLPFISPRLKFSRDYNQIRPYTDFCRERIEMV